MIDEKIKSCWSNISKSSYRKWRSQQRLYTN